MESRETSEILPINLGYVENKWNDLKAFYYNPDRSNVAHV